jgi:hypothetical protein
LAHSAALVPAGWLTAAQGAAALAAAMGLDKASGFDVSVMNAVSTSGHFPVRLNTWPHRMMYTKPADNGKDNNRCLKSTPSSGGMAMLSLIASCT